MLRTPRLVSRLGFLFSFVLAANAHGQTQPSVDILSPGEPGYETVPDHLLIVDLFVEVATTDVWTAAGIRALTAEGARFDYYYEPNNPAQPRLINPGIEHRLVTSISKPRGRDSDARFNNALVAMAGGYNPPSPTPTISPTELNIAYFASPPATSTSPSVDGYVARLAIDLSGTPYSPNELVVATQRPSTYVLACAPPAQGAQSPGFIVDSFDHWTGISFWITVPEPSSLILMLAILALGRVRPELRQLAIIRPFRQTAKN